MPFFWLRPVAVVPIPQGPSKGLHSHDGRWHADLTRAHCDVVPCKTLIPVQATGKLSNL